MEYQTISVIHRENKLIVFLLRKGEDLTYDNIVDVEIESLPIFTHVDHQSDEKTNDESKSDSDHNDKGV